MIFNSVFLPFLITTSFAPSGDPTAATCSPDLKIPKSNHTVRVRMIDTTSPVYGLPLSLFIEPPTEGFDTLSAPAYYFLIEHESGRKVLLNLGVRIDPHNLAPIMANTIAKQKWTVKADKGVRQILEENGVKGKDMDAIIWSRTCSHFFFCSNCRTDTTRYPLQPHRRPITFQSTTSASSDITTHPPSS